MARIKRGDTDLSLLLAAYKPDEVTSHDVVNEVRHIFGERRVGHAGTLDPFATGVLPIMIGPATKLMQYFSNCRKEYVAEICFGSSTDTHDLLGDVVEVSEVPEFLYDEKFAEEAISKFVGTIMQTPPIYSAIKIGGRRAYEIARGGKVAELTAREVTIYRSELMSINTDNDSCRWKVVFEVSSGTYIRSIARDIASLVNCPAHLTALIRTKVGGIELCDALSLDDIARDGKSATIDPAVALGLPIALLSSKQSSKVKNGLPIKSSEVILCKYDGYNHQPIEELGNDIHVMMANDEEIFAIYRLDLTEKLLIPTSVFHIGVKRGKPTN